MCLCDPLNLTSVSVGIKAFLQMQDRHSTSYVRDEKTEAGTGLRVTELVSGKTVSGIREMSADQMQIVKLFCWDTDKREHCTPK